MDAQLTPRRVAVLKALERAIAARRYTWRDKRLALRHPSLFRALDAAGQPTQDVEAVARLELVRP